MPDAAKELRAWPAKSPMTYAYRVEWSPEDNEFVGLSEFPSLSAGAPPERGLGAYR